ncbi:MAG: hypothetical protein M1272_06805 [Firmicutes bacterium]|nr:hypothetical protein [Bacillota bacterium]
MVHLVIAASRINPLLQFRIIQADQYPHEAERAGVQSTPTLAIPPDRRLSGNLPPAHLVFYLWEAATQP